MGLLVLTLSAHCTWEVLTHWKLSILMLEHLMDLLVALERYFLAALIFVAIFPWSNLILMQINVTDIILCHMRGWLQSAAYFCLFLHSVADLTDSFSSFDVHISVIVVLFPIFPHFFSMLAIYQLSFLHSVLLKLVVTKCEHLIKSIRRMVIQHRTSILNPFMSNYKR